MPKIPNLVASRAITGGAFVRAVIDELDLQTGSRQQARKPEYKGAGPLARLLGVDRVTVTRWLDNEREPEFAPMIRMLMETGWLTDDAKKRLVAATAASDVARAEQLAQELRQSQPPKKRSLPSETG